MTRRQILVIIAILLLTGLFFWFVVTHANSKNNKTGVNIQVVPNGARISINNRGTKEGFTKTVVGRVHIEVSLKGFESTSQDIDVSAGETRFAGFALVPNTPETADWYDKHTKDKIEAEGLSSKTFDDLSNNATKKQPFVKDLPYIGPADEYRIDYGPDPNGKSTEQVVYITAGSQIGKDDALNWIRDQGYDPATMTIIYKNP